MELEIWRLF